MQDKCWICESDVLPDDNFCRNCGAELVRSKPIVKPGRSRLQVERSSAVGVFLTTLGVIIAFLSYLMDVVPMLAFGLASLLIGIMVIFLPESDRSVGSRLAVDSSLPSLLNIENLLEDLDLDERGIYIPASGLGVCPKVFVPLAQTAVTTRPPLGLNSSRRVFVKVGENQEDRGILLDAPGSQIMSTLEQSLNTDFAQVSIGNLGPTLDSGLRALGIVKTTVLEQVKGEDEIKIEIRLSSLDELEMKLRNLAPRLVSQIGTPIASTVTAAVSKATGKYVTLKSAILETSSKKMTMRLKLNELAR